MIFLSVNTVMSPGAGAWGTSIPPFAHDLIFFFTSTQKQSINVMQFIDRVGSPLDFRQLMTNDNAWGNN